jgi:hypothetical protein
MGLANRPIRSKPNPVVHKNLSNDVVRIKVKDKVFIDSRLRFNGNIVHHLAIRQRLVTFAKTFSKPIKGRIFYQAKTFEIYRTPEHRQVNLHRLLWPM